MCVYIVLNHEYIIVDLGASCVHHVCMVVHHVCMVVHLACIVVQCV